MIVMPLPKWLIHLKIWLYNSLWQPSFLMLLLEFIWIDECLIKKQADAICTQLTFTISSMGHAFVQWNWLYLLDILPLNHLYTSLPERQLSLLLQINRMRFMLISMVGDCGLTLQCLFDVRVFSQMHLVITTQTYHPSLVSWAGDEVEVWWSCFGRLRRPLLPPCFCDHWGMGKEVIVFYHWLADLLFC